MKSISKPAILWGKPMTSPFRRRPFITGWWFGTFGLFSIYWECHNPNWLHISRAHVTACKHSWTKLTKLTFIFFRGVGIPPTSNGKLTDIYIISLVIFNWYNNHLYHQPDKQRRHFDGLTNNPPLPLIQRFVRYPSPRESQEEADLWHWEIPMKSPMCLGSSFPQIKDLAMSWVLEDYTFL